ncbi:MAG: VTT domain-containing protein [Chthoniobacteraceae bacterium]|nr:VTT domain-containing protein [Chthoniobacteraceae bacterium]
MTPWLETYLHSLGGMGLLGGVIFILSLAGLSLFGLPLIPFAVAAGLLFGIPGGLAGIIAGSTLGAAVGFLFSRYVARKRVAKFLNRNPKFVLIDQAIHREGWKIIGLLRLCPIPFGVSNFAYGLTNVPFAHYLFATILGMLPGEIVFVCMGSAGKQLSEVNSSPALKVLTVLGVCALFAALFVLRRIVGKRLQFAAEE